MCQQGSNCLEKAWTLYLYVTYSLDGVLDSTYASPPGIQTLMHRVESFCTLYTVEAYVCLSGEMWYEAKKDLGTIFETLHFEMTEGRVSFRPFDI